MRRLPAAVTVAAALIGLAMSAKAGPLPVPLHDSTSVLRVPAGVRTVVVQLSEGTLTVTAGAPGGKVHKQWNLQEPTFTSTFKSGTLTLHGECGNHVTAGGVWVNAYDPSCGTDLTLSVPAGVSLSAQASQVSVSGVRANLNLEAVNGVTVDHAGPGSLTAKAVSGSLRLSSSRPSTANLESNGALQVQDVITRSLVAHSYSASASLTRVNAPTTSVQANGAVALSQLRSDSATVTSDSSSVSLSDVKSTASLSVAANGTITAMRTFAPRADLRSASSGLTLSDSAFSRLSAEANSLLSLTGVTAPRATVTSQSSGITIRSSALKDLTGTANSTVDVALGQIPSYVKLTSSSASLTLEVPRAHYAVNAQSSTGRVTYGDLVIDPRASRILDLSAENDITVN